MRALVFVELNTVEVRDEREVVAGESEVIVHVARTGICGSELHGISQPGLRTPPLIMGHEFVGTTDDGRRVVVNPLVTCAECDSCRRGETNLCRRREFLGIHRPGGHAERVVVPHHLIHDLPVELSWDRAALVEPIANAVHAWNVAGRPVGGRVGVIGCGPIGLACIEVARHFGASGVDACDLSEERRGFASTLGADTVDVALGGEYDVVFEAVGVDVTRRSSIECIRPGGIAVWLGLTATDANIDAAHLVRFEKRVRGAFAYTDEEFRLALDIAPSLQLNWSTTFDFADGAAVFTSLMNGADKPIKALLKP